MKKRILVINGSASANSSNEKLISNLALVTRNYFQMTVFNELKSLPHFDPALSENDTPNEILEFRKLVKTADGIIICTPEYVFSIPSGLKNAIEWCVSTTVFMDKPTGLITASANGERAHEELQLVMKTLMAKFVPATTWLINGIRGKIDVNGNITNTQTSDALVGFAEAFRNLIFTESL